MQTGNGLRSAASSVDTAWPSVLPLHHAGKLGRSPRPARVCNQEEAAAVGFNAKSHLSDQVIPRFSH